ncbi:MAG: tetratricopeptide repeat protein [Chloroflexi bacterium]|nr:tetratricopeptide repeat protein [Chloroflexota bacterium]
MSARSRMSGNEPDQGPAKSIWAGPLSAVVHASPSPLLLILIGCALLLWPARGRVVAAAYNNVGAIYLNRALLTPDSAVDERTTWAVRAGQAFQTALSWDPLSARAYANLGAVYDVWGASEPAARALQRAVALAPDDPRIRFRLGQALAALGHEARAVAEWRAAEASPYFVAEGQSLTAAGEPEQALVQCKRALTIDPQSSDGYYCAGQALARLGRREEALAALESAAGLEPPDSPRRYLLRAEVTAARGDWVGALTAFERAAALTPRDPLPRYRMGVLLASKLDDTTGAEEQFRQALALAPDYRPASQALGELLAGRGECDVAAELLLPASGHALAPVAQGNAHVLIGQCLLAHRQPHEGLGHLETAVSLAPESTRYRLVLARGLVAAEQYRDAIDMYRSVLALEPDNEGAIEGLEALGWSD